MDDQPRELPPLARPPDGFDPWQCMCRWCFLWGWLGPVPRSEPTARNPVPLPRAVKVEKSPEPAPQPAQRTLFDE